MLDGGRQKPLDTLAWETLRLVSNRSASADPETGHMLEPTAFYLSMLFDWPGWDDKNTRLLLGYDALAKNCLATQLIVCAGPPLTKLSWCPEYLWAKPGDDWRQQYARLHASDKWDQAPLLRVDYLQLKTMLGLKTDEQHLSPATLTTTLVKDPRTDKELLFPAWGEDLAH